MFAIISLLQDRHTGASMSPCDNLSFATRPLNIFKTMVEESVVFFSLEFSLSQNLITGASPIQSPLAYEWVNEKYELYSALDKGEL